MLVISRKKGERTFIQVPGLNSLIEITMIEIRGEKVRLGFHAAAEVKVYREEVWKAIQQGKPRN